MSLHWITEENRPTPKADHRLDISHRAWFTADPNQSGGVAFFVCAFSTELPLLSQVTFDERKRLGITVIVEEIEAALPTLRSLLAEYEATKGEEKPCR